MFNIVGQYASGSKRSRIIEDSNALIVQVLQGEEWLEVRRFDLMSDDMSFGNALDVARAHVYQAGRIDRPHLPKSYRRARKPVL